MLNAVKTSIELEYLDIPDNTIIDISEIKNYSDHELAIITTGTQGEPMSALSRIASSEHKQVAVKPDDKIIISASSIPGNEKMISKVINELLKRGADVVYEGIADVHVSGHACQEELKLMMALTKPKYFMPVHGEFMHLSSHKELAISMGIPKENIFLMRIGDVLEISKNDAKVNGTVPSGQVLIDGLGVGDVGNIVLRDRQNLAENGIIIVVLTLEKYTNQILAGPDIVTRGFDYVRESENLIENAKVVVTEALEECLSRRNADWGKIKMVVKDSLGEYIWKTMKRNPMILPIIMEVE